MNDKELIKLMLKKSLIVLKDFDESDIDLLESYICRIFNFMIRDNIRSNFKFILFNYDSPYANDKTYVSSVSIHKSTYELITYNSFLVLNKRDLFKLFKLYLKNLNNSKSIKEINEIYINSNLNSEKDYLKLKEYEILEKDEDE